MGRAPCCDKARVRKGPWSVEEDTLLLNFMTRFGNGGNWIALPAKVGLNRCGKSCRLRWLNYLRPDIKHGGFTKEEDYIIYHLYHTIGSRWSVIASNLPGRTDNDVKNYWHTKLKKKIIPGGKVSNNVPTNTATTNSGISSKLKSNLISPTQGVNFWQNLDDHYPGQRELFAIEESLSTSSTSSEISRASSSVNSDQNGYALTSTSTGEEDGFWMDLLSESFDDDFGADYFQLEEKINEIASLLGA